MRGIKPLKSALSGSPSMEYLRRRSRPNVLVTTNSSPRTIHAATAAAPRLVSSDRSTSRPRWRRDSSPRNIHVAAAASPRPIAATRLRGLSASRPRRRRDSSPRNIHVAAAASPRFIREISTSSPRPVAATRRRDPSPRNIHVPAAAASRPALGLSTSQPRRRRDPPSDYPRPSRGGVATHPRHLRAARARLAGAGLSVREDRRVAAAPRVPQHGHAELGVHGGLRGRRRGRVFVFAS